MSSTIGAKPEEWTADQPRNLVAEHHEGSSGPGSSLVGRLFCACRCSSTCCTSGSGGRSCSARIGQHFIERFARRGANRLGLAQHFTRPHHGAWAVLATHEAGHGCAAKRRGGHKGRTGDFGFVAQAVGEHGCFGFGSCHWRCLLSVSVRLSAPCRQLNAANSQLHHSDLTATTEQRFYRRLRNTLIVPSCGDGLSALGHGTCQIIRGKVLP